MLSQMTAHPDLRLIAARFCWIRAVARECHGCRRLKLAKIQRLNDARGIIYMCPSRANENGDF